MSKAIKIALAAAAGFAAGILLAPKSGEQTRNDIKHKALRVKKYATGRADEAREVALDMQDDLKESATLAGEEARGFARSAQTSVEKVGRNVSEESEKLTEEAKIRAARVGASAKRTVLKAKDKAEKAARK